MTGKRVILSTPEGFIFDVRAIGERYVDKRNRDVIDVVTEEDYYRWMFMKVQPERKTWSTHLVWVEG